MEKENSQRAPALELRTIKLSGIELRELSAEEGGASVISGVIPYNSESEEMWGYIERIAPGAFKQSLESDVRCLWNHNSSMPLGRTLSDTLVLSDTQDGLDYRCTLPDTSWGRDAKASISRGDVTGTSFGFLVRKDHWEEVDGQMFRTILEAKLIEVSPVTFPAYPDSTVEARSQLLEEGKKRVFEARTIPLDVLERELEIQELEMGGKK